MSKDWKLFRIVAMLSQFSAVQLQVLLAMVRLELFDRLSEEER